MIATALLVCLLVTQEDSTARRLAMEAQNLYRSKDYPAAKERAEAGAKAGSSDAMILLAVIYSSGNGALRDYGEALRWYRQAADAGSAVAMYNLALLYLDGRGTEKNTDEADRWFLAAADAGYKPGNAARQPNSGSVNGTGTPVTPPSVKFRRDPKYSEQAQKMLVAGRVLISSVVGTDGIPRDLRIVNPLGFGLDQKAVEAAANWRFNPGMKDGHPVNVRVRIDVNFRFDKPVPQDRWKPAQMVFEKPDGTSGPLVTNATALVKGPKDENETVSFEFTVDQSGHASDIRVLHGSTSRAAPELTQQLAGWTFGYADKPDVPAGAKGRVRFILNDGDEDAKQPLYPPK